jgi:hypothetical protein
MTQEEIIEMARQHFCRIEYDNGNVHEGYEFSLEELEAFTKLVAAKEREACAKAEKQESVCPYCHASHTLGAVYYDQNCVGCVKRMATTQPQREWVGLTDEEVQEIALELPMDAVRITEAKLKARNT